MMLRSLPCGRSERSQVIPPASSTLAIKAVGTGMEKGMDMADGNSNDLLHLKRDTTVCSASFILRVSHRYDPISPP